MSSVECRRNGCDDEEVVLTLFFSPSQSVCLVAWFGRRRRLMYYR